MRRLAPFALALAAALPARAAPARLGDFSLGGGPAIVVDRNSFGAGATAEANLLWRWFSLGMHGRLAAVEGEARPAAGIELGAFGFFGLGASLQAAGPSIDGLLQIPIPVYAWQQTYLTVGYRPGLLLGEDRGWVHEIAVQIKWSSLLVPETD